MHFELAMIVVVEALDSCLLDGAVHPFDLPIGPGMLHFGQAVFDAILATTHVEHVGHVALRWSVGVARWERELDAVVGQNGMDPIGHRLNQGHEEGGRRGSPGLSDDLREGKFARAINGHVKVQLTLSGLHLGDIDMEKADRVGFEPPLRLLVSPPPPAAG